MSTSFGINTKGGHNPYNLYAEDTPRHAVWVKNNTDSPMPIGTLVNIDSLNNATIPEYVSDITGRPGIIFTENPYAEYELAPNKEDLAFIYGSFRLDWVKLPTYYTEDTENPEYDDQDPESPEMILVEEKLPALISFLESHKIYLIAPMQILPLEKRNEIERAVRLIQNPHLEP